MCKNCVLCNIEEAFIFQIWFCLKSQQLVKPSTFDFILVWSEVTAKTRRRVLILLWSIMLRHLTQHKNVIHFSVLVPRAFPGLIFRRSHILIGLENYHTFATLSSEVDSDFLLFVNSLEYFRSFQWYTLRTRSWYIF